MRVLLDAHIPSRGVGRRLEASGHDVRALDREPQLEGLADDDVLALAAADGRILVTHNISDFPRILRDRASAGHSHSGVILVYGIGHAEFGLVARGIERWLAARPRQDDWLDFAVVVDRTYAAATT